MATAKAKKPTKQQERDERERQLLAKIELLETRLADVLGISDFTRSLERALQEKLDFLDEPSFTNPTTGRAASSVDAVLKVLRYGYRGPWSRLVGVLQEVGGQAVFQRQDLKKRSAWPTLCVDLERVEPLLLALQPRRATQVIATFKQENNLNA